MNAHDAVEAHGDFESWVNSVSRWLETWVGHAAAAQWSALEYSRLVDESGYSTNSLDWVHFRRVVRERLTWISETLKHIEASVMAEAKTSGVGSEVPRSLSKVFIVHGHDEGARETVARFIEKIGLQAVILHERANKGRTIITKFREEAADIGFAVVLMTPDDQGGKAGAQLNARARQNVVFELGFFIGALGADRVAALVKGDVERPSDFEGVLYISLDQTHWKTDLDRELQAAGFKINWNKVMAA